MKIALFGLPKTGKTTIFQLLTGLETTEIKYDSSGVAKPHIGTVNVPDERVDFLHSVFPEHKKIYPQVEYLDIVGLKFGDVKENLLLAHLRQCDLLAHVVRDFKDESVYHSTGTIDPLKDVLTMEEELLLADLIVVEGRIERLKKSLMKNKNPDDELELETLQKIKTALDKGKPLRELKLSPAEEKSIRSFGFLTLKPLQIIVNIDEKDIPKADQVTAGIKKELGGKDNVTVSHISANVEKEISEMDSEGVEMFMDEYGLEKLASERLIEDSFNLLGLISFLTYKGNEVRSWQIPEGTTAQQAAGEIHTDIEKGFIAAQVIKFDDFKKEPDIAALKQKGLVKVEGKEYIVEDGDIIDFRFNV